MAGQIGPICATCRTRRTRNPAPCARCDTAHVLVARDDDGTELCGPCTGHPELDWTCRRCGHPGDLYAEGCCTGCVVADRLDALFERGDGTVATQLEPLLSALKAAKPWTILNWLKRSTAALLAELAAHPDVLTHATLDALPLQTLVELPRTAFRRDSDNAFLVLGKQPVLLPPSPARLVDRYLAQEGASFPYANGAPPVYLLRGRYPNQPRNAHGLATLLTKRGLHTRTARNTTMLHAVTDMPSVVVADLFGLTPSTTTRWAQLANSSWNDYLAADAERQRDRSSPQRR
ncbi:hypothetical protein [Amycolatopsis sp. NPDC004079]|uniref:hypothetical protein n=1 Tax=Amycolatopsis sp. NPDC004079 TaxID=3154549 RepID=UPI0033B8A78E